MTIRLALRLVPVFLAGTLLASLADCAGATALDPFDPGLSPCRDACPLEWAAEAADVEPGEARPMTLPAGSILSWMSYARDGEPYGYGVSKFTTEDHTGEGFPLGDGTWFFRFDACGNWSIVWPFAATFLNADAGRLVPASRASGALPASVPAPFAGAPVLALWAGANTPTRRAETPADPPPAIPLPAGGWLLLTALGAMMVLRRTWK